MGASSGPNDGFPLRQNSVFSHVLLYPRETYTPRRVASSLLYLIVRFTSSINFSPTSSRISFVVYTQITPRPSSLDVSPLRRVEHLAPVAPSFPDRTSGWRVCHKLSSFAPLLSKTSHFPYVTPRSESLSVHAQ